MLKPPHLKANIDRIEELDSHVNVISSLEWAQNQSFDNPPKLLSTSFDGSARIWTFSRQKWNQIEINCITDFIEAKADPKKYPKEAWYTYYDITCDYKCMAIEYLYWGVATYLGFLEDEGIFSQMLDKYIKNIL